MWYNYNIEYCTRQDSRPEGTTMSSISSTEAEPTLSHSHTATIALEVIAWMVAMPVAVVYGYRAINNEGSITPVVDVAGCLALLYIVVSSAKLGKQVLHRLT